MSRPIQPHTPHQVSMELVLSSAPPLVVEWLGSAVEQLSFLKQPGLLHSAGFSLAAKGTALIITRFMDSENKFFIDVVSNCVGGVIAYGGSHAVAAMGFVAAPIALPTALVLTASSIVIALLVPREKVHPQKLLGEVLRMLLDNQAKGAPQIFKRAVKILEKESWETDEKILRTLFIIAKESSASQPELYSQVKGLLSSRPFSVTKDLNLFLLSFARTLHADDFSKGSREEELYTFVFSKINFDDAKQWEERGFPYVLYLFNIGDVDFQARILTSCVKSSKTELLLFKVAKPESREEAGFRCRDLDTRLIPNAVNRLIALEHASSTVSFMTGLAKGEETHNNQSFLIYLFGSLLSHERVKEVAEALKAPRDDLGRAQVDTFLQLVEGSDLNGDELRNLTDSCYRSLRNPASDQFLVDARQLLGKNVEGRMIRSKLEKGEPLQPVALESWEYAGTTIRKNKVEAAQAVVALKDTAIVVVFLKGLFNRWQTATLPPFLPLIQFLLDKKSYQELTNLLKEKLYRSHHAEVDQLFRLIENGSKVTPKPEAFVYAVVDPSTMKTLIEGLA